MVTSSTSSFMLSPSVVSSCFLGLYSTESIVYLLSIHVEGQITFLDARRTPKYSSVFYVYWELVTFQVVYVQKYFWGVSEDLSKKMTDLQVNEGDSNAQSDQSSAVDHASIRLIGLALPRVHVHHGPSSPSMTKLEILLVLLAESCFKQVVSGLQQPRLFLSLLVLLLFNIFSLTRNEASVWLIL